MEDTITRAIVEGFSKKLCEGANIDVAIVGAGPSGLVCGHDLAEKGYSVSIFEKKLAPGGGIWGGAMLNNDIVIQLERADMLDEFGISYQDIGNGLVRSDSVETASALIYKALKAGAKIFNAVTVEDVIYKEGRVGGVVINWAPVLRLEMHVDPMNVVAKAVLDATGHDAWLTAKTASKAGINLDTPTGGIMGEKPMWAEVGEKATVDNTSRVYPGLYVSGMAANGVFGSARMGPIFGGMLMSGRKAAELMAAELG
ncbi:MAG: sulfide-dependent adenosine diphosphate thiazole synthase [Verrucomicrobiota bacterium]